MEKNNSTKKAQNFVIGAFVIACAHIAVKIIGAIYKIPLDRYILHPEGMGYYDSAYTIYSLLFTVSTAGIPIAISKMVSESVAKNDFNMAEKIFSASRILMLIIGSIGSAVLFLFSDVLAAWLDISEASVIIKALSPSILFVCISSAYRGYSQGRANMLPTALSEVTESLGKLVIGLGAAALLARSSVVFGSAGAILGVTCGTLASMILLIIITKRSEFRGKCEVSGKKIVFMIIKTAIPITIGAAVFTLTNAIDTAMVIGKLKAIGLDGVSLKGYLSRAVTLFNMPPTVISAIAISVVPAISASVTLGERNKANDITASAVRLTTLISSPCAVGLCVLSMPILQVLYGDGAHSELLTVMGAAVFFVTLVQTGNAVLQANGKVWHPVLFMAIGGVVKVIVNYFLLSVHSVNILGAPISTLICYAIVMLLDIIDIKRISHLKYGFTDAFLKPIVSAAFMGAASYGVYEILFKLSGSRLVSLAAAIAVGAAVYFAFVFIMRAVKKCDVVLLPCGEKIAKILEKFHLIRG